MRCSRKLLLFTLSATLCLGASGYAGDKKDKSKDDPKNASAPKKKKGDKPAKPSAAATPTPAPAPAATEGQPPAPGETPKPTSRLSLPLPKGQDSKGITIPYTDATGKKTMLFRIGVGNRLDEDNVKMTDLTIQTYDEAGKEEMTIAMPDSMMNLATRMISGDQSVTIKRNDFQLTGKTMEFNTETKQGWVKGDVKMIIYDMRQEAGDTPTEKTDKKGDPGS